jgi:hypothetical protein
MENKEFNNSELQKVFDECLPKFINRLKNLEKINSDIKNLEKTLCDWAILPCRVEIQDVILEFKDKRIRFLSALENIDCPLIECKIENRMKCAKHLPEFLRLISQNLY